MSQIRCESYRSCVRGIAAKHEMAWLYKWIKNSSDLIKSGDPQAVKFMKKTTRQ
jgi:hypothetical protein